MSMIRQRKPKGNFENSTTDPVINPNDVITIREEIEASRRSPLYLRNTLAKKKGEKVLDEKQFLEEQRKLNATKIQRSRDKLEKKILEKEGIELIDDTV